MERGCSQGSVLGPTAWNWCMDSLLQCLCEDTNEDEVDVIAYADDVAVLLMAHSRNSLEKTARQVSEIMSRWRSLHKLKIVVDKTNAMTVKVNSAKADIPPLRKMESILNLHLKLDTWVSSFMKR